MVKCIPWPPLKLTYEPFFELKIDGFVSCYMSTHGYFKSQIVDIVLLVY